MPSGAESFTNLSSSYLSAAITSTSATSLTVLGGSWPTANFRVRIDSEILFVSSVSGTTFTVIRGIEGTTSATHSAGAFIFQVITAGSLTSINPANSIITIPPAISSLTWDNQGSATAALSGNNIYMAGPGSMTSFANLVSAVPGTPWSIIVKLKFAYPTVQYACGGIILLPSGTPGTTTTSRIFMGMGTDSNKFRTLQIYKYSNDTTFSASYLVYQYTTDPEWLRVTDDGTNLTYYISWDGVNWQQVLQTTRTNYITVAYAGITVNMGNTGSVLPGAILVESFFLG